MCSERTIFDPILACSMLLNIKLLLLQRDAIKGIYKNSLAYSDYVDVLTQVWKYIGRYPVAVYVYEYEGKRRSDLPRLN